jgi:epoxide hydrolase
VPVHGVHSDRLQEELGKPGEGGLQPLIAPLTIHFPDSDLDDLRRRLESARLPEAIEASGWTYGVDVAWLRDLLGYWRTRFDWRAVERELNCFENGYVTIDDLRVHVLHARSRHAEAMPLLLCHGWPGSVLEFMKVIGPLTDPVAHGGEARDAFHVVAPSLPGYGFSDAPRRPGYDAKKLGRMLAEVMPALGYERYGAQGGDWGGTILPYLAIADPVRCAGLHLNLVLAPKPPEGIGELTPEEMAALVEAREYMKTGTAYQRVQGLEPDLIGVALTDSPAALCAWIVSKFRSWSDCDGDVERRFTRDELLANVTLYWLTKTGASAARSTTSRFAGAASVRPGSAWTCRLRARCFRANSSGRHGRGPSGYSTSRGGPK